jgi:hypothetical protein
MATSRSCIWVAVILCLGYACTGKKNNNDELIKYLDKSLQNSKILVNKSTEYLLSELEEKTKDPATAVRGRVWFAKAQLVREYSKEVYGQIEDLKRKLMAGSINKNIALKSVPSMDEELTELVQKLKAYNKNLLKIDPELNSAFSNYLSIEKDDGSSMFIYYPVNILSTEVTLLEANYLLNQFQNNIKITENRMVQFSNNKVGISCDFFDSYSVILGINTNRAAPGTKMEIIAGVGAFSARANPKVLINGTSVNLSEDAAIHYEFTAPQKPGKYHLPVKIEFTDEIGKRITMERDIEYSVVK